MPKVHIPIAVEVSQETADAIGKSADAIKTAVGIVRGARDMRIGEQVIEAFAAARKAVRRRR